MVTREPSPIVRDVLELDVVGVHATVAAANAQVEELFEAARQDLYAPGSDTAVRARSASRRLRCVTEPSRCKRIRTALVGFPNEADEVQLLARWSRVRAVLGRGVVRVGPSPDERLSGPQRRRLARIPRPRH